MRTNRYIKKCVSALLILILMLKAGGDLYLHNWLHSQKSVPVSSATRAVGENTLTCTCIDDFYVPFTETPEQVVQEPYSTTTEFVAAYIYLIPFSSKFFHSLRGPPSKA